MEEEIRWESLIDFPNFKISNTGIVKNFKTGNVINQRLRGAYYGVTLHDDGNKPPKIYHIHKLIGIYFIPNPHNFKIIDHINGEKLDNNVSNLRWCTQSTNAKNSKRTNGNKIIQCNLQNEIIKKWDSASSAAIELNLKIYSLRKFCINNKPYKGFIWSYENKDRKQLSKPIIDINDYINIGKINENDFSKYSISKDGSKIINNRSRKELKFTITPHNYKRVILCDVTGKRFQFLVHKIINQVLKNGDYNDIIDHINSDRQDNSIDNLEAVTRKENIIRAIGKSVRQFNIKTGETIEEFRSVSEAHLKFNKTFCTNINRVCNGGRKSAFGYGWEWI